MKPLVTSRNWPFIRDVILFFSGLAGLAYETVAAHPPQYELLPIFAGMLGAPAFLRRDGRRDDLEDDWRGEP